MSKQKFEVRESGIHGKGLFVITSYSIHYTKLYEVKMLSISLGIFGIAIIVINSKPLTAVGKLETFGIVLLLLNSALGSFANIKVAQMNKGIGAKFLTSNQMRNNFV